MRFNLGQFVASTTTSKSGSTGNDIEKQVEREDITPIIQSAVRRDIPPKLAKFQNLIGICSSTVLRDHPALTRPAPNEGIYKRTVDEEAKVKLQYNVSNYVVNVSGMAQIIVGAAVTALGAADGPKAAVTVLGAANTIMAGLLTYLKGQGLPGRVEQYLHLLRTLREHIEERERELMEPDCALDVDEEIKKVIKMYQEVRQSKEDNAPGTLIPPRGAITALLEKPDIRRSEVAAPRGDKGANELLATGLQDLSSFQHVAEAAVHEREGKMAEAKEAAEEGAMSGLGAEIAHLEHMAIDTLEKLGGGESSKREDHHD